MEIDQNLRTEFEKAGRVWLRQAISEADLSDFDDAIEDQSKAGQRLPPSEELGKAVSSESTIIQAMKRLDLDAKPVRVVAFNKSEDANWGVPWHQDRVIAVAKREQVAGYDNWTKKSGVWHCEPPLHILDQMLFVRVHLDNADQSNGAMEIAVGSHKKGVIPSNRAEEEALEHPIELCDARRGDVLILKMLTVHSSKPAQVTSGRRTLRIDFSASELPEPLEWARLNSNVDIGQST